MFKLLMKTSIKQKILVISSVLFIFLQVYLDLKVPDYMSEITQLLQSGQTSVIDILKPGSIMLSLSFLSLLSSIIVGFFVSKIASGLAFTLRNEVYSKVMNFSQSEIQQFSVPSLITRTTNDINQIQVLVSMGLQVVVRGPIMAIWALAKISNKNWQWSALTATAVVILMIFIFIIMLLVRPTFKKIQKQTDQLNAITRESLLGVRVVRAYNAENFQNEKFNTNNVSLTKLNLFAGRTMSFLFPMLSLISSLLSIGIYWIGAMLINEASGMNKISLFSDMIIFTSYAMQVVLGFIMMVVIFMILPRALESSKRINEVLNLNETIIFKDNSVISHEVGEIEFKNVSFSYPNAKENVIENISFKAKRGQTIAFIGSTGSGKSTIVSLIPRYFDVTDGEILLNGKNINEYSKEDLMNKIGYVSQKPVLFSGTIASNLSLGKSNQQQILDQDIWYALELAQAKDFVSKLPDQLNAPVSQGGINFSGGQKQRLAIARVFARKPEIIIFDDSFSALDFKTDKILRATIAKEMTDTTKLIVAQRISTIMDADQIIVLEQGKIVGQGTHNELLKTNTIYQEIAYSQLSQEELMGKSMKELINEQ